jgi:hypothetical protein
MKLSDIPAPCRSRNIISHYIPVLNRKRPWKTRSPHINGGKQSPTRPGQIWMSCTNRFLLTFLWEEHVLSEMAACKEMEQVDVLTKGALYRCLCHDCANWRKIRVPPRIKIMNVSQGSCRLEH